jgi:hypothetical protein
MPATLDDPDVVTIGRANPASLAEDVADQERRQHTLKRCGTVTFIATNFSCKKPPPDQGEVSFPAAASKACFLSSQFPSAAGHVPHDDRHSGSNHRPEPEMI